MDGVRRVRRHEEYTSITDAIDLDESSPPDKVSQIFFSEHSVSVTFVCTFLLYGKNQHYDFF